MKQNMKETAREVSWWVRAVLRLLIGVPFYIVGLGFLIVVGSLVWIVVEDMGECFPFRKYSNAFAELVLDGFFGRG